MAAANLELNMVTLREGDPTNPIPTLHLRELGIFKYLHEIYE